MPAALERRPCNRLALEAGDLESSGEDSMWGWAVPWVMRTSATNSRFRVWPTAPGPQDELTHATGYWTALLHLLLYSFGWSRPDVGLSEWSAAGRPSSCRHLRLINETYGADGQLDWFALFLYRRWPAIADQHGFGTFEPIEFSPAWAAAVEREAERSQVASPLGGLDSLHLGDHCTGPLYAGPAIAELTNDEKRVPTLRFATALGWYGYLLDLAAAIDLPDRMNIYIETLGRIGTFTRSHATGRFHAVPHWVHRAGQDW